MTEKSPFPEAVNIVRMGTCSFLALFFISSCAPESHVGKDSSKVAATALEANEKLVRRLFEEGFSGGDLAVVEEIFSPDIVLVDPNLPPGIEGVKAIVRKNNETFDDWRFTIHDLLAVDDKVVARWTGSGVHANSFMGEEPTGKTVELNGMAIYQIKDGKIVTDWVFPDNLQFLIQLGVLPPMGMAEADESN